MPRIPLTNIHIGPHQGYGHEHTQYVQPQPCYNTGYYRQPVYYGPGRGQMVANDLRGAGHQVKNAGHHIFHRY